jgi:hypothetical protein
MAAAAGNDNSVMDIEYDDMAGLMGAAGIFSFCVYTWPGAFNADIDSSYRLSVSGGKRPHVYFVGILSYVEMINRHPEQWANWRIVVHTDQETIESNPKAFRVLKSKGVIFGLTRLKGRYSDIRLFRGIFRNNRYYPLFIQGLNVPVIIRDADTIYESELVAEIVDRLLKKQKNNTKAVIDITSDEIIPDGFVEKINKWEHLFVEKISAFDNKVIFTYDDGYSLPLKNENNIGRMAWSGRPENRPKHKPQPGKYRRSNYLAKKVRFLAGNLSKVGAPLPSGLWTHAFPEFLSKYITNANIASDKLLTKTTISDEVFLTEVIYPYCKENNRAEFYKMNYVSSYRLGDLFNRYVSKKYPENVYLITEEELPNYSSGMNNSNSNNNKNKVLAGTPPRGPALGWGALPVKKIKVTRKTIRRNKLNENNQKLFNITEPNGLRDMSYTQRPVANKLSLENPEIMMNANFFFNPLTGNMSMKPKSLPPYFFGGTNLSGTNRRRLHKRKTHKNRK